MKKSKEELVQTVVGMQNDLNNLTVDEINKTPDQEIEPQTKITARQIADKNGYKYIEAKRKLPAFGVLPERLKKEHARDWEYVAGILENIEINGEPIEFWYVKYPGDPDCLWEVPCNRPVYVPRFIAKHLEEVMKYHKFAYIEKSSNEWRPDEETHNFQPIQTCYRAKFRPIEAFA